MYGPDRLAAQVEQGLNTEDWTPNESLSEFELDERKHEIEQMRLTQKLLPARNVRTVVPRVCGSCKWGRIVNGTFECLRVKGYQCDAGDGSHWYHTCDLYQVAS